MHTPIGTWLQIPPTEINTLFSVVSLVLNCNIVTNSNLLPEG